MEIAVLSDIHGNHIALERCLATPCPGRRHLLSWGQCGRAGVPTKNAGRALRAESPPRLLFCAGKPGTVLLEYRGRGAAGWQSGNSLTGTLWYVDRALRRRDLEFLPRCRPRGRWNFAGCRP